MTCFSKSPVQRIVLELKIKRGDLNTIIEKGHLIIFDRTKEKTWDERIWYKPYQYEGHPIMVWGM